MATGTSTPASRRVGKLTVTPISDREAELTRVFDAPRRLVFEAHSKPEHVRHWWGPRDSTMVSCEMDFRPGGAWRFVLRTADGNEAAFRGEYREIVPPERIVQTFEFEGMPGAVSLETLTLEDLGDRTRIVAVRNTMNAGSLASAPRNPPSGSSSRVERRPSGSATSATIPAIVEVAASATKIHSNDRSATRPPIAGPIPWPRLIARR